MKEIRFISITSCKNCEFNGHTSTITRKNEITHFCTNPKNMEIEQLPAEQIGKYIYPITSVTKSVHDSPIPFWCKLGISDSEEKWISEMKVLINKSPSEKAQKEVYHWLKDCLGYYKE